MINHIIFIFSISLQISAAATLALRYVFMSTEDVKKEVDNKFESDGGKPESNIPTEEQYRDEIVLKYKNTISFTLLAVGYLIGVLGLAPQKCHDRICAFLCVILLSIVFSYLSCKIAYVAANKRNRKQ